MAVFAPLPTQNASTASVATSQTTTTTTFTDLATTGPAVTLNTNTLALVIIKCKMENNTAGQWSVMGFAVSGATTTAAADASSVMIGESGTAASTMLQVSSAFLVTLTAGSNTFTAKYRVTSGTGTFVYRDITVIPLN